TSRVHSFQPAVTVAFLRHILFPTRRSTDVRRMSVENYGRILWFGTGNIVLDVNFGAQTSITNKVGGVFEVQSDASMELINQYNKVRMLTSVIQARLRHLAGHRPDTIPRYFI